ncbi:MAG: hypothetical protein AABX93_02485 [Nanoarchaeota archaeon]
MKLGWRIWLLLIVLALSVLSIFGMPPTIFDKGAVISSVETNSTAFEQGLRQGQIIIGVDEKIISNSIDYQNVINGKFDSNESEKIIIITEDSEFILFSKEPPALTVSDIPKTNLKLGLDLAGGARALVKAQDFELTSNDAQQLTDIIKNRLNVYGLEDIKVNPVSDLSGNNFVRIEIAGATPEDLTNLISQQGKFEAKIGDDVVFTGGEKDITSVARSGQEAYVETPQQLADGTYVATFHFTVYLSPEAAKRHADLTSVLEANYTSNGQNYLSKKLDFYIDNKFVVDGSLLISEGLKGFVTTQISISGSGAGATQNQAYDEAVKEMNRLQTILVTGSLPYKLEIVKLDTLSSLLGEQFIYLLVLAGCVSILVVSVIVFIRYRKIKESFAVLFTSFSEIIIILGIAALMKTNLDLPAIAGILATIGTGVDQQIVILDEARRVKDSSLKERMKRAIFIIMAAYVTALVSLLPLIWAGAGLFKGFAITTIIGITAGVLITRPAFTEMIKMMEKE